MSYAEVAKYSKYPWIRPSSFIKTMAKTNDLGRILSGKNTMSAAAPLLREFWNRYRKACPQHELFTTSLPLHRCVPLYIHGDGGVTQKKGAVLLISFQGVLGQGTSRRSLSEALTDHEGSDLSSAGIPLNFLKTGFQSRFLCIIAPKDLFWVSVLNSSCVQALYIFKFQ